MGSAASVLSTIFEWVVTFTTTQTEMWTTFAETADARRKEEPEESKEDRIRMCGKIPISKPMYTRGLKFYLPLYVHLVMLVTTLIVLAVNKALNPSLYDSSIVGVSGASVNLYGAATAYRSDDPTNSYVLWDAPAAVRPVVDTTTFTIPTKIHSLVQTRGVCQEHSWDSSCTQDSDCKKDSIFGWGTGVASGTCSGTNCLADAWCPVDDTSSSDSITETIDVNTANYTIVLRNYVAFKFSDGTNLQYSNIDNCETNDHQIQSMQGDDDTSDCPYFSVSAIVNKALDVEEGGLDAVKDEGAVISIRVEWDCSTDSVDTCQPLYHFTRLDNTTRNYLAKGYNFTQTVHPFANNTARMLVKTTAILFIVEIDAIASQFSPTLFFTHIAVTFAIIRLAKVFKYFTACLIAMYYYKIRPRFCLKREEESCIVNPDD